MESREFELVSFKAVVHYLGYYATETPLSQPFCDESALGKIITHTHTHTHIYIYIYIYTLRLFGWLDLMAYRPCRLFNTRCIRIVSRLFSYGHLKFSKTLDNSVCDCYTSYGMTDQFLWFHLQTATAAIGIHPTKTWLSQLVNFKNAIWQFRRTRSNKTVF